VPVRRPGVTEMYLVDGGIVQVTRMDREEMEAKSSSVTGPETVKLWVHKLTLRLEGKSSTRLY